MTLEQVRSKYFHSIKSRSIKPVEFNMYMSMSFAAFFIGKSLVCKEKVIQTAAKEEQNSKPRPVYFISLVGVNRRGNVEDDEYIYDMYTKLYDFSGLNVEVLSAQDLLVSYQSRNSQKRILKRIMSPFGFGGENEEQDNGRNVDN